MNYITSKPRKLKYVDFENLEALCKGHPKGKGWQKIRDNLGRMNIFFIILSTLKTYKFGTLIETKKSISIKI